MDFAVGSSSDVFFRAGSAGVSSGVPNVRRGSFGRARMIAACFFALASFAGRLLGRARSGSLFRASASSDRTAFEAMVAAAGVVLSGSLRIEFAASTGASGLLLKSVWFDVTL